jgi:hypothetical protein
MPAFDRLKRLERFERLERLELAAACVNDWNDRLPMEVCIRLRCQLLHTVPGIAL